MNSKRINSKISQHHLDREAVLYLRQSSDRQVQENLESQRLQYALADWARDMGWAEVEIIDADLGVSASVGAPDRDGFDRLIELVVQRKVGIILSREASRLSRTEKDWCRVFEVCPLFDTLIGDGQQVYDLNLMDDQLVMGIKGTMSVVELRVLQSRLRAAAEAKAQRGELDRLLPPGYVRDAYGKSLKDPDRRVREAIELVFRKFGELWSVRQTFLWFHSEGVKLPVNKKHHGRMGIIWQLPTYPFVKDLLQNPYYAGVYVWGRRQTETVVAGGKVRKRQTGYVAREQWKVFLPNHHEAYIDWDAFEENQRRMSNNSLKIEADDGVRAVRSGQGLLVGLLRCGRCGRKLDDVEVIRKMAPRYGDDDIARVLNKLGRRTGMGKRWSMQRVARVRRQHSIAGRSRTEPDPEVLTQHTAAKYCGVSLTTIKRLVAADILPMTQVVPWAPWEIRRSDLDRTVIRDIVQHLRNTRKLVLSRGASDAQRSLFPEEMA